YSTEECRRRHGAAAVLSCAPRSAATPWIRAAPPRSSGSGSATSPSPSRSAASVGSASLLPASRTGEPSVGRRSSASTSTNPGSASRMPGPQLEPGDAAQPPSRRLKDAEDEPVPALQSSDDGQAVAFPYP